MLPPESPLMSLRRALAEGGLTPVSVAQDCLAHANANQSHNTYLSLDPDRLLDEARALESAPASRPLYGVPVSLKDCFNLAGTRTTFGSSFYAAHNPIATDDSAVASRLRKCGCLIPGKTHLHPLAYGITGQNPDFGDCLQPRDATLLTGGSSSGAAASVQEGSALAAIGTDTGGSIRVPAALCGLTGYRASHSLAAPDGPWPEMWAGSMPLAPSFDTLGLLFRDPRDAAPLAEAIFHLDLASAPVQPRIGCVPLSFLHDSTPPVLFAYAAWKRRLRSFGALLSEVDPAPWAEAVEIFSAIQAHEASVFHRGRYDQFGPLIAQRLHWGASITPAELGLLRQRHAAFRTGLDRLFASHDFLVLPVSPTASLFSEQDQSTTRTAILRYTAPFSLGGLPTVTLPGELLGAPLGTGVQLATRGGADPTLLALITTLGQHIAAA